MSRSIVVALTILLAPLALSAADDQPRLFDRPALGRDDFNRLSVQLKHPFFWREDKAQAGVIDPGELVLLGTGADRTKYVDRGAFTEEFKRAYLEMVEARRREAVRQELDQGRPTLVYTDFTGSSEEDRAVVRKLVAVGRIIDELYQSQTGAWELLDRIPREDRASLALFHRNQGVWCAAPRTQSDPFCSALASFPPRQFKAYPAGMKHDAKMCESFTKMGERLMDPFTVVRTEGKGYKALPITEVYGPQMKAISILLSTAADAIKDPQEKAFQAYLRAAARGFDTNEWEEADEAWAAMNAENSKWYLRVAPDEVYFDPCSAKAGFHLSFAQIDRESLKWQSKLSPLREEMERSLAKLIGAPYEARKVSFHMPDFISIVLNAGNSRSPLGATVGQSLPNWGKVAQEGRGRTVVMSNLYTDADSQAISRRIAASLLDKASMASYSDERISSLLPIILHEATHNFGPHSDYRIEGKRLPEVFGGPLATTLEELKAETGALWYLDLLLKRGVITAEEARRAYTHGITWCFGHISRGMFSATGQPKPYSQLAAVHVGFLMEEGALSWVKGPDPETGREQGMFVIHFDRLPQAVDKLMAKVGRIKATGAKAEGQALIDRYVKGEGAALVHQEEIAERVLRYPKASFVYGIGL